MADYTQTPFPQQIVVETTAACDQHCVFCGRNYMDRPKKTMHRETFRTIVQEIARENPLAELWPTFMGEAMLLRNRFFDMIRDARQAGCRKITLNSNGNHLNEKTIPDLLDCGVDRFIVSCDGHTKKTYERIRVGGRFERLHGGVIRLLETMRRQGRTRPLIEMQFSVFHENEHEVEDFKRFWLAEGVVVKVRPKLYWSGNVSGGEHRVKTDENRIPCSWSMDTCAIHWNGNVVMCAVDCDGKYVAGNIEAQSIKEIWNGPLKWVRELHLRRRFRELPEVCRRCPDWNVKRAEAFFPNSNLRADYVSYIRMGRTFMQDQIAPQDYAKHISVDG